METMWLKGALFGGMTANAFKLGTVLTLGWFWPRFSGCCLLYRGGSVEQIDFANILAVVNADASEISPPSYAKHDSNSIYFYVVRRANNCGCQEHTLSAAVKVVTDADGELAEPQPNGIFGTRLEQAAGSNIKLIWYYCPVGQKSAPVCFKVYCDGGMGQIDYENPIAVISYTGRRFYSHQSDSLDAGTYLFAIRAEGAAGTESGSQGQLRIQLDTTSPEAVDILSAKTV